MILCREWVENGRFPPPHPKPAGQIENFMKIDYEELQMAMNFNDLMGLAQHFSETETGEVLLVSDWVEDEAQKFGDPAALDDETIRL